MIAGLGNPGREYELTRHNVGWMVVDHLADVWHFDGWRRDGDSLVSAGRTQGTAVRLVKPQTFMNLSGAALRPYLRRPMFDPAQDLLIIVDDAALPLGRLRLRASGSSGGHNGLKSVEAELGSRSYARIRIGVAPSDPRHRDPDLADFVLSPFGKSERAEVLAKMSRIAAAVETWLSAGVDRAMNLYNREPAES
ncbi:MAG: aminoacyl-tRNA hydrolase [Gemmatimonadota bacterium]|nr:aminoacyl-tRNA hydrolase [Gemmatimonadota bacterium]